MKTHTDVKVWLCDDAEVIVHTSGNCAWAEVSGSITLHALGLSGKMEDLDILEKFFQQGLTAVQEARQGQLFNQLTGK